MTSRVRASLLLPWIGIALTGLGGALASEPSPPSDAAPQAGIDVVVIDPGHGGPDYGARGASGLWEKDVVLEVGRRIGAALEEQGLRVVYTRADDRFVSLPERTDIANRAKAQLYLSIHANASHDEDARGPETFFLSLEASDEEALGVALTENEVFDSVNAVPDSGDLVGAILGDLIRTEHLRSSGEIASEIQHELERLPGPSRGVKQAPFVVLMGVNMPAVLLEIGFLTHVEEERQLRKPQHQQAIARGVATAVKSVRERRQPAPRPEATP